MRKSINNIKEIKIAKERGAQFAEVCKEAGMKAVKLEDNDFYDVDRVCLNLIEKKSYNDLLAYILGYVVYDKYSKKEI